ncbi:hypothetical protein [Streptomyces sp. CA-111067]
MDSYEGMATLEWWATDGGRLVLTAYQAPAAESAGSRQVPQ